MDNSFFPHCSECSGKREIMNKNISKDDLFVAKEAGRCLYFAPVGNQFNFGTFANGHTPKIIIMGITASPTARNSFIYTDLRGRDEKVFEPLRNSCIWNTFNSENPRLQIILSKIINIAGIPKMIGYSDEIRISRDFFEQETNLEYSLVLDKIYFSQMIICASCEGEDGSTGPTKLKDLGPVHRKCIESQLDFISSFKDNIDLLIYLGDINRQIINQLDTKGIIKKKCRKRIRINHPSRSKGWNLIDLMHSHRDSFEKKLNEIESVRRNKAYRTEVWNCYDQLSKIKNVARLAVVS